MFPISIKNGIFSKKINNFSNLYQNLIFPIFSKIGNFSNFYKNWNFAQTTHHKPHNMQIIIWSHEKSSYLFTSIKSHIRKSNNTQALYPSECHKFSPPFDFERWRNPSAAHGNGKIPANVHNVYVNNITGGKERKKSNIGGTWFFRVRAHRPVSSLPYVLTRETDCYDRVERLRDCPPGTKGIPEQ